MEPENNQYRTIFNSQLAGSLRSLSGILRQYPASARSLLRVISRQPKAERRRARQLAAGIPVPPLLIVSTTDACNLNCAGCYAHALRRSPAPALPEERIRSLLREAEDLGVSVVLLAGGEPLLQTAWLDSLAGHPALAGLVFTNGTMLKSDWLDWFDRNRQIVPVISVEGSHQSTDLRRGAGISALIRENLGGLQERGIPFGLSITLCRDNLELVRSDGWIRGYLELGCRLFIYVEYVPAETGTEEMALTLDEKQAFTVWVRETAWQDRALLLVFPGDEEPYGGCLASARGFVHISTAGDLEPCPFAPFSDQNINQVTLAEALQSRLLRAIREQHHLLQEGRGGCALWQNRQWVAQMLETERENP